jgi:hypothetical protein
MIEYVIVFAIVGVAVFYTIRKLAAQTKGRGCDGCSCAGGVSEKLEKLIKAGSITGDKPHGQKNKP